MVSIYFIKYKCIMYITEISHFSLYRKIMTIEVRNAKEMMRIHQMKNQKY